MRRPQPERATTVAHLLRRWPATTAVFVRRGMACPGCAMAPFETIADVSSAYRQELVALLADLRRAAGADDQSRGATDGSRTTGEDT